MDTEGIILISMGILLIAWVLFCVFRIMNRIKQKASVLGLPAWIQCEKCDTVFEISADHVIRGGGVKNSRKMQTIIRGGVVVRQPVYKSYKKKLYCPTCRKKTWGQVQNLPELQKEIKPISGRETLKGMLFILIGGSGILALTGVILHMVVQ